jgi:hypothetical protein
VFAFGSSIAKRIGEDATSLTAVLAIYCRIDLTLALTFGRLRESFPGVRVGILSEQ